MAQPAPEFIPTATEIAKHLHYSTLARMIKMLRVDPSEAGRSPDEIAKELVDGARRLQVNGASLLNGVMAQKARSDIAGMCTQILRVPERLREEMRDTLEARMLLQIRLDFSEQRANAAREKYRAAKTAYNDAELPCPDSEQWRTFLRQYKDERNLWRTPVDELLDPAAEMLVISMARLQYLLGTHRAKLDAQKKFEDAEKELEQLRDAMARIMGKWKEKAKEFQRAWLEAVFGDKTKKTNAIITDKKRAEAKKTDEKRTDEKITGVKKTVENRMDGKRTDEKMDLDQMDIHPLVRLMRKATIEHNLVKKTEGKAEISEAAKETSQEVDIEGEDVKTNAKTESDKVVKETVQKKNKKQKKKKGKKK